MQQLLKMLKALAHELQFRNTKRAHKLRVRIKEVLEAQGGAPASVLHGAKHPPSGSPPHTGLVIPETERQGGGSRPSTAAIQGLPSPSGFKGAEVSTTVPAPVPIPGPEPVLAAWLALEILTPQPLPSAQELAAVRRQLVRLEDVPEPWYDIRFGRRGKERTIFWIVYLAELDVAKALASILKVFPDEAVDERNEVRGTTTLAVIVLDAEGRPVLDKTFLSSFAWGYGKVRVGQLRDLATFVDAEKAIKAEIERRRIGKRNGIFAPPQPPPTSGPPPPAATARSQRRRLSPAHRGCLRKQRAARRGAA